MSSSSNRLFRFPKPDWLNSANTRTAGVYIAGALVRRSTPPFAPLRDLCEISQFLS